MTEINVPQTKPARNIRFGLTILGIGVVIYTLGINPDVIGQDRSSIFGVAQISFFLVGLGLICLGGFSTLTTLWNGAEKTIIADIGQRLVATGYVIAFGAGLADVFGFGTQTYPAIPYFGYRQVLGVLVGLSLVILGFIAMIPRPGRKKPDQPV
jgi:hypothetical protein